MLASQSSAITEDSSFVSATEVVLTDPELFDQAVHLGIRRPNVFRWLTVFAAVSFISVTILPSVLTRSWRSAGTLVSVGLAFGSMFLLIVVGLDEMRRDRRFRREAPELYRRVSIWLRHSRPQLAVDPIARAYRIALRRYWLTGRIPTWTECSGFEEEP